jgi:hypothetical protein
MPSERSKEGNQPRGGDILIGAQREVQTRATAARRQGAMMDTLSRARPR